MGFGGRPNMMGGAPMGGFGGGMSGFPPRGGFGMHQQFGGPQYNTPNMMPGGMGQQPGGFGGPPPMGGFGGMGQPPSQRTGNNDAVQFGKKLGNGQFGEVFKATYKGRTVAAKTTGNPTGFPKNELSIMRAVQSEHVAELIGEEQKTPQGDVILMKLYRGSLDDVIKAHPTGLGTDKFLMYMEQVCKGLHFLHMKDVIFNDLKPDNLLMEPDCDRIVFADFGDARMYDASIKRPQGNPHELGWGSPHYHCRPDVMSQMLSTKSDMWMLAQLAHHMWTGAQPSCNPGHLRQNMPLYELIQRCLSEEPKDRPSAASVLGAIRQHSRQSEPVVKKTTFGQEKTNTDYQIPGAAKKSNRSYSTQPTVHKPATAQRSAVA